MRFAVIAHSAGDTNRALASRAWPGAVGEVLAPRNALLTLRPGDVALNRLDVLKTLNGVEDGLWIVSQLEANGVRVLNPPSATLAAHDKLLTARLLEGAGLPHPRTLRVTGPRVGARLQYPVVCKPRFGSWGRDVELVHDEADFDAYCSSLASRWWWRAGAVAQELVEPVGYDLRVVVAGGRVVGAASRRAAVGDWRTNVARGGRSEPATVPALAAELAVRAVGVVGLDLGGVDLLPSGGGWVVLEVNGAVDFTPHYCVGGDVYAATMDALAATSPDRHTSATVV